jgi:hypothetical protein
MNELAGYYFLCPALAKARDIFLLDALRTFIKKIRLQELVTRFEKHFQK